MDDRHATTMLRGLPVRLDQARRLLGVVSGSDVATIRRRYHRLARDLHPDAGGDAKEFARLQEAYAVVLQTAPSQDGPSVDRAAERRADLDRERRERERLPDVDVASVDWDSPLPSGPTRLDPTLFALAAASDVPVGRLVAVSRGPKGLMNRLAHTLDDTLTTRLESGVRLDGGRTGLRMSASGKGGKRLMDDLHGRPGWGVVRKNSDVVVATRPVPADPDVRVTALRHRHFALEALDALGWPLDAWTLVEPLST